jgi:protein-disulfide isomerase
MKKFALVGVLLVGAVLGGGAVRLSGLSASRAVAEGPPPAPAGAPVQAPVGPRVEDPRAVYRVPLEDSPLRGPSAALVTVVEVSDFECPFCKRSAPTLQALDQAFPGKLRFAFKHNPLPFHASAGPAAIIAEEARAQGGDARFWALHDELFEQPALDAGTLTRVARQAGLDEAALKAALVTGRHMDRIRRDQGLVGSLGATGTPTFFVNGRKITGAQPLEAFKVVVGEELAKAEALVKSGVAPGEVYARTIERGATAPVTMAGPPAPPAPPVPAAAAKVPVRADDAIKGPALAPVTVVLFSDFQCPFCGRVEPTLAQLEAAFPGKLRFAWRHQPLPFHANALPAARAAEAARLQGQFWPMHDRLFSDQAALSEAAYAGYARALGLDEERFRRDAASEATGRRIAEDQALATAVGATGTPTAFVNCRRVVGAQPLEAFRAVVAEELRAAEAALARGVVLDAAFYDGRCASNVAAAPAVAAPAPRTDVKVALRSDDPSRGAAGAKVTVIEFSDFQCPFCSRAVPEVKALEQDVGRDLRVVWKHLPLGFHQQAMPAALAAEAAREQGRFWEMHDKLFAAQAALSDAVYLQYAGELKLDLSRFTAAMQAPETRRRVEADAAAATAAGVNGTPSFVVNGELVVGTGSLRAAVARQLERVKVAGR